MNIWLTLAFVMIFICTPILIGISYDIPKAKLDLKIILAPITVAWVALIALLIYLYYLISSYS